MISIENRGNVIEMFTRENDNPVHSSVTRVSDFKPYFYYDDWKGEYKTIDSGRCSKVFCNNPKDVRVLREKYGKTFEADVVYTNRYIIDKMEHIPKVPIRKCYVDIEIEKGDGFTSIEVAGNEILCIGCYDSFDMEYKQWWVNKYNQEVDILEEFVKYVKDRDPDILIAWNGDNFDFPYLLNRMRRLKFNINELGRGGDCYVAKYGVKVYGRVMFDLMYAYKKMVSGEGRESWSLDYISRYEKVGGKEQYKGDLDGLYRDDVEKFLSYNKKDVELLVNLDEKLNIVEFFDEVRRLCLCRFEDVFMNSKIADCLCLKYAKEHEFVLPTSKYNEGGRYTGGLVHESQPKLHKNIAVMDMKSLYPSIMIGFNTSYETLLEEKKDGCISVGDKFYFESENGMIPSIVKPLLEERKQVSKRMKGLDRDSREYKTLWLTQYALKIIANSFYGVLGFPRFRLYKKEVAGSITFIARMIIREVMRWFEDRGYDIVYGDTDSVFVDMKGSGVDDMENLNSEINEYFKTHFRQYGVKDENNIFKLEFEKVFRTVLFKRKMDGVGAKKKYAGRITWQEGDSVDKMVIVGFESRRSDTPTIGRELLKQVLKMIVYEEDKEEIDSYVKEEKRKIREGEYAPEEIAIPMGLTKNPDEYGNQIHARASRNANKRHNAQIKRGDKIKYLYVIGDVDVIAFNDYLWDGYRIDYDKMVRRIVDMKVGPIYEGLGWEYDYIVLVKSKKKKGVRFENKFKQLGLWE